ncbi:MAG: hypothetical protein QOE94_3392, partial [Mycobacterium sp.]|nr:hypothetical protein [Mycobacterium sp.]
DRKRDIDAIISDVRGQVEESEPAAKVEFVQVLQDMIGDLTSQPEPVVIKLFSEDAKLLEQTAPKVGETIGKIKGVVDVLNGIENTISGPAVTYQVDPSVAARAGFTPEDVAVNASAILEGEPAALPVILNDRPYTIRVRFPESSRSSLESMSNTLVASSTGKTATLGSLAKIKEEAGQTEIRRENLQRLVEVTGRFEGVDLGTGISAVKKAVSDMHLPSSIRVEYGGIYEEQQKSFHDLLMVLFLALYTERSHLVGQGRALVAVREISRQHVCPPVQFFRQDLQAIGSAGHEHQSVTAAGEFPGDLFADSRRRTGDDGDAVATCRRKHGADNSLRR